MGKEEVCKVEAILFASGKAMEEDHIKELASLKPKQAKDALMALKADYEKHEGALFIFNDGTRWKINVKEDYIALVKSLVAETELDKPVLETLAMIAYKTPVLQADIIKTRGDGAYAHITELVERGFVTKEKYARSFKLKLNEKFYHYFDVEGDKDIRDVFKDVQQPEPILPKEQKTLGELEVVDAETDAAREEERRKETQLEIFNIEKQRDNDKKHYLNDFENRLSEVKGRVDEAEKDILEQKKSMQQEEVAEGEEAAEDDAPEEADEEEKDPAKVIEEVEKEIEELTSKKSEQ